MDGLESRESRAPLRPSRYRERGRRPAGRIEALVLGVGLAAAVLSGIIAYRTIGPYGDGPFGAGFRRIADPAAAGPTLVREFRVGADRVRAVVEEETGRIAEWRVSARDAPDSRIAVDPDGAIVVDRDIDGDDVVDRRDFYADLEHLRSGKTLKEGFSLAGDGVIDAWAFRGPDGRIARVEVSTRRDGVIDRWEHYEEGVLVLVETDADGDGIADARSRFVNGILAPPDGELADGPGTPSRGELPDRPAPGGAPR